MAFSMHNMCADTSCYGKEITPTGLGCRLSLPRWPPPTLSSVSPWQQPPRCDSRGWLHVGQLSDMSPVHPLHVASSPFRSWFLLNSHRSRHSPQSTQYRPISSSVNLSKKNVITARSPAVTGSVPWRWRSPVNARTSPRL